MIEHGFTPEHVLHVQQAALGLYAIAMAFSASQRRWIRRRDGEKCNFPAEHDCDGDRQLNVHHILSQRYCTNFGIDPDYPTNAITICEKSHTELIHEDMIVAKREYRHNRNSYKEVFAARARAIEEGRVYWETQWDRAMNAIAVRNTQQFERQGEVFPKKKQKVDPS